MQAAAPWCDGKAPESRAEWKRICKAMKNETHAQEVEKHAQLCSEHHNLANYWPATWATRNEAGINTHLHSKSANAEEARLISAFITGGQNLRAGDPQKEPRPSTVNCCMYCLEVLGHKTPETLEHVVLACPAYTKERGGETINRMLGAEGMGVLKFHRDNWRWPELNVIRTFIIDLLTARERWLGSRRGRRNRNSELAERLWK